MTAGVDSSHRTRHEAAATYTFEGLPTWPRMFQLPADTVPYLAHIDSLLRCCVQ
jgi:hypothetical protein